MTRGTRLRKWFSIIAISLATLIIAPIIAEFFIEWARQLSVYKNPQGTVDYIVAFFSTITGSWWFITPMLLVTGGAITLWLEYFLRSQKDPWALVRNNIMNITLLSPAGRIRKITGKSLEQAAISPDQPLRPTGLWLSGQKHKDGVDLYFSVVIRNRSQRSLRVRIKEWDCQIENSRPEILTIPVKSDNLDPSSSRAFALANIRIYSPKKDMKGWVEVDFIFDAGESEPKTKMSLRYTINDINIPNDGGSIKIRELNKQLEKVEYTLIR